MSSLASFPKWGGDFEEERVFDAAVFDAALLTGNTPFDVVHEFLDDDGEFGPDVYRWLVGHGCDCRDVARLARSEGVTSNEWVAAVRAADPATSARAIRAFLAERPATAALVAYPCFDGWTRPRADTAAGQLPLVMTAWAHVARFNKPPQVFRFGGSLTMVIAAAGDPAFTRPLTVDTMKWFLRRLVQWGRLNVMGDCSKETGPPHPVAVDMLAEVRPEAPTLQGVAAAPAFAANGDLCTGPGYEQACETFVWPINLSLPFVPRHPSPADVATAKYWLDELLGDFPFEDQASKANTIATLLVPFVRPMIDGPIPLVLIDKPTPGSGGTLLAEAIGIPALGKPPSMMGEPKDDEEFRRRYLSLALSSPVIAVIDNVKRMLDSPTLALVLTTDEFSDRLIKTSNLVTVPIRHVLVVTGNNVTTSAEIARRTLLIRLDPNTDHPEDRQGYKHPNLIEWAKANRGRLVWAVLVLVNAWIAAGRPAGTQTMGKYESFVEVIGGILDVAGIEGFLANSDKLRERSDDETARIQVFIEHWWGEFGDSPVTASDLQRFAPDLNGCDQDFSDKSAATLWGYAIRALRDQVIAGYKVTMGGERSGAKLWKLIPVHQPGTSGEPDSEVHPQ